MGCVSTYAVSDEPASEEGELGADSTTWWVRRRVCSACPSALIPVALLTLRAQGEQVRLRPAQEAGLLLLGPLTATNPSGTLQLDLSRGRVQLGVRG